MRLGIMQPYFFPYIGYISLIKHTDLFILFDSVQFIRHGWIERNRILKPNEGWQYIQVPLIKASRDTLIKDMNIDNTQQWKDKIFAQVQHYKKKAPYYFQVLELLHSVFEESFEDIVSLNKWSLNCIMDFLKIDTPINVFSEMDLKMTPAKAADEWALNICKSIDGANEYLNPIGGMSFFDKTKYDTNGINLKFQIMAISEYSQRRNSFEEGLSILDIMMFNSPEEINIMLDKFELI